MTLITVSRDAQLKSLEMSLITLSRDAQLRSLDLGKDNVCVCGRGGGGKQESRKSVWKWELGLFILKLISGKRGLTNQTNHT